MENTSDNQEKEKKTRVGRKKLVVTAIGVGAAAQHRKMAACGDIRTGKI